MKVNLHMLTCDHGVHQKHIKREMYDSHHFDVKLAPEFLDAKLIICITFPDKPGEGSTQVTNRL
jgi:hypothetical protein